MKHGFRILRSRTMVFSIYIILGTITIPSINFKELSYSQNWSKSGYHPKDIIQDPLWLSKFFIMLFRVINVQHSEINIIGFFYLSAISLLSFLYLRYYDLLPE